MMKRAVLVAGLALALSACQEGQYAGGTKHLSPIPPATLAAMTSKGMSKEAPILIRSFKKESELEVWKRAGDGRYALLKTFPICRWSGQLGPKVREGDRQAPEGFYTITPAQMNPNSSYYLSFDTGFPNAYDRAHGRSGMHLMVHGSCSSRGCFAMTDEAIAEVYAIGREAFAGGQRSFQFQSYPFRMTAENLAKYRHDPHMPFWLNLKEGSDYFEVMREEPRIAVCGGRYVFGAGEGCSAAAPDAVAQKRDEDEQEVAALVAEGTPAVRIVYEDGGGHQSFRETMVASAGGDSGGAFAILDTRPRRNLGDVSRPDALAMGPREIPMEASPAKAGAKPATALAFAPAEKPEEMAAAKAEPAKPSEPKALAAAQPKPVRTVVASADPEAIIVSSSAPAPAVDSRSLYRRMVGLFRDDREPAPARTASAVEPEAKPSPVSVVPSVRKRVEPTPAAASTPAASPVPVVAARPAGSAEKPVAAKEARQQAEAAPAKRVEAPAFQQGPGPDLTKPSTFSPVN